MLTYSILQAEAPKLTSMPGRQLSVRPIGLIVLGSLFVFTFSVSFSLLYCDY